MGLTAAGVAALVTTVGLILIQPFLRRMGMMDAPGNGRSHEHTTLRGAGIAMIVGTIAGAVLGDRVPGYITPYPPLWLFLCAVTAFALVGFLDDMDVYDKRLSHLVSALVRLVLITVLAVLASYGAWRFTYTPWWIALLGIPALIFYVNAVNFMDGINGITGMHGLVVGGYFALIGYLIRDIPLIVAAVSLAVAFACFLPWNIPRARMFGGDAPVYGLGAGVWAMAVWASASGASHWAAIAPMGIYGVDVLGTIVKRLLRRESLTARHREFIFAQFSDKTSHVTSAVVVTVATIICSICGLLIQLDADYTLLAVAILIATCAAYLLLPMFVRHQERRDGVPAQE